MSFPLWVPAWAKKFGIGPFAFWFYLVGCAALIALLLLTGCSSQRAETLNATGIERLNANDAVGAAAAFGSAVKLNPNVAKYHYNLGLSYAKLHYADEAAAQFQEALKIEPGDADASRMLTLSNASIAMRQRGY